MQDKHYFPAIDLIRFPVSIGMIIYHYGIIFQAQVGGKYALFKFVYQYWSNGVEMFFAISGFLAYWAMRRKCDVQRKLIDAGGYVRFLSHAL